MARDYKKEYKEFHGKPEEVKKRSERNQARRKLGLEKGNPLEVDHKVPLKKGGSNAKSNLRAVPKSVNRKKAAK